MLVARARTWRSEQTEHVYTETNEYQAGTWNHARRVRDQGRSRPPPRPRPRDNPRFVVTNMRQTPRFLYEKVYCARGDAENRIKELKALQIDRTSCQTFSANQLRVLLTAAAYVAADTACARAQVPWPARPGGVLGGNACRNLGRGGISALGARRIAARWRAPHR